MDIDTGQDKEKTEMMTKTLTVVGEKLRRMHRGERGLSTAELLGNAALAVVALLAIWAVLQTLGTDIVGWIRDQLSDQLEN